MSRGRSIDRSDRADAVADADVGAALGYSRPGSYEELRAVLSSGTARLPKKLRQVAIHLWQHPTAVALGTVTSVAGEAGVQPSTLVRFAQAFGYTGFSDLQDVFKAHLADGGRGSRDRAQPHWEERFERRGGAPGRWVHRFVRDVARPRAGSARPRPIRGHEPDAGGGGSHLHHRLQARLLARELRLARARQSWRAQPCARQCRLDRVRTPALRIGLRRGPRRQLYALQFHHPGIGRLRRSARRSDRLDDRQRVQPVGSGFEGLYRGDRREFLRVQVAFGDARGGDGAGAARRAAAQRSGFARADSAGPRRVGPAAPESWKTIDRRKRS